MNQDILRQAGDTMTRFYSNSVDNQVSSLAQIGEMGAMCRAVMAYDDFETLKVLRACDADITRIVCRR